MMDNINVNDLGIIQAERAKEIKENEHPALDAEGRVVMMQKRLTIDEPPTPKNVDPLR